MQGLRESLKKVMPDVDHKFCARHMYAYFKLGLKDRKLKDLMWAAARSCTTADFDKFMELVKKEMQKLIDVCRKFRQISGVGQHFLLCQSDMLTNNMCEIFNH